MPGYYLYRYEKGKCILCIHHLFVKSPIPKRIKTFSDRLTWDSVALSFGTPPRDMKIHFRKCFSEGATLLPSEQRPTFKQSRITSSNFCTEPYLELENV